MEATREQNEAMLITARCSIDELDRNIKDLNHLRDVWMKICGKIEGELHGRILPLVK